MSDTGHLPNCRCDPFGVPARYSFRSKATSVSRTQERPQTKGAATNRALVHPTCFSANATEAYISLAISSGRFDLLRHFFGQEFQEHVALNRIGVGFELVNVMGDV
jgi:hypothetical protein